MSCICYFRTLAVDLLSELVDSMNRCQQKWISVASTISYEILIILVTDCLVLTTSHEILIMLMPLVVEYLIILMALVVEYLIVLVPLFSVNYLRVMKYLIVLVPLFDHKLSSIGFSCDETTSSVFNFYHSLADQYIPL